MIKRLKRWWTRCTLERTSVPFLLYDRFFVLVRWRWDRLWIRRDEFHSSLSGDLRAYHTLKGEELVAYRKDLLHRRAIAHKRDLTEIERRYPKSA
jgi:hypothetical protein